MQRILAKREKIILYTAISIIIFSLIFNFLFMPVLTQNNNINKEIGLARNKLIKYSLLLNQKKSIQARYNQFAAQLRGLDRDADTSVSALSELENLAKSVNIRIVELRPQAPKSSALYKELFIELRCEGAIEDYLKFIYSIENSILLLKIKKLQLNAKLNTSNLEGNFLISQLSTPE